MFVEHVSAYDYQDTVKRIEEAIERSGLTIFARIDHAAAAQTVGMEMPRTMVLIYGNPRGGTPIMLTTPRAALDLPLRVLIREDSVGSTLVGYHPIVETLRQAGVDDAQTTKLGAAQEMLLDEIERQS